MNKTHLLWFLEKVFSGVTFQSITFSESGYVFVKFFDSGGNFHDQIWTPQNTVQTVE